MRNNREFLKNEISNDGLIDLIIIGVDDGATFRVPPDPRATGVGYFDPDDIKDDEPYAEQLREYCRARGKRKALQRE